MAKKATAKAESGGGKKVQKTAKASDSGGGRKESESTQADVVDALIKLLQSPLVIDLLAVGATAALAAITEHRSSQGQGGVRNPKRAMKAAGKAAAAAVGRRLANEFEEIKAASRKSGEERKTRAGAEA